MDAVSEIKQKLDIVDVVASYITVKKAGKNYSAVCPFHSENTPSFNVSPDLQIFKCFGCGETGDMFSFVEKIEGVDFPGALKILADKAGVVLEQTEFDTNSKFKQRLYSINQLTARFYNYLLTQHRLGTPGLDYFTQKRNLSKETINAFLLGYAPVNGFVLMDFLEKKGVTKEEMLKAGVIVTRYDAEGYQDKFRGRVLFPLTGVDGKIVGFSGRTIFDRKPKYLNTSETLVFHKGSFVYALNAAKLAIKKKGAVLVEGHMDVITAHQAGLDNVIAASGTAVTDAQLQLISRYTKDITLSLDSDSAGINAAFRAVDLAEKHGFNIKVAITPEGSKDLDELVRKDTHEAERIISAAVPAYDFFIKAAIKLHNKNSPDGKKRIMEELMPKFARISNKVLKDHYSGEIAKVLGAEKNTVLQMLTETNPLTTSSFESIQFKTQNEIITRKELRVELYLLSLLLKLPYDDLNKVVSELSIKDFLDEEALLVFGALNEYIKKHTNFTILEFVELLDETARKLVQELYIGGMPYDDANNAQYLLEVSTTVDRIKHEAVKRHLKDISVKIKLAESENNDKLIAELTEEFNTLSKKLL